MKKIVVNKSYGGFSLSEKAAEILDADIYYDGYRENPALIKLIEEMGTEAVSGRCAKLRIETIPDEATDWFLDEYDGWERIIYVVDGKIYFT